MTRQQALAAAEKAICKCPYVALQSHGEPVCPVLEALPVLKLAIGVTMSSLEIADLTGKRHDNVMADITKMLEELDFNAPDFSGAYKSDQGNTYPCSSFPRDLTETLITGYSPNVVSGLSTASMGHRQRHQMVWEPDDGSTYTPPAKGTHGAR